MVQEIRRRRLSARASSATPLALARDTSRPGGAGGARCAICAAAAEKGLATALFLYGMMHDRGVGVPQDQAAAARYYAQAAEKGHRVGAGALGLRADARARRRANPVEGEVLAAPCRAGRRSGSGGAWSATSMPRAATLPPNYAEAAMWFRRAVDANHKGAARALGMLHLTGAGVPRDQDEAARLFRIAAQAGDTSSHVDLGNLLLKGHGDEQDQIRTREWFEQAAESGDLIAAFNFGVCLAEGVGIERDDHKAAEWLRRAADGVVNAQYWYGRMLVEGRGVETNAEEGRAWITKRPMSA